MTAHAQPPDAEIKAISHFVAVSGERQAGRQLELIRQAAPAFRDWFSTTGMPDWIGTFDLVSLPYPTRFGLFRAAMTPAPYLSLTHRLIVVRWHDTDGRPRTLLFEPTDVELARRTPYFARLSGSTPNIVRACILASARRRADASAERRHRRQRRRLDHVRPSAHAGRAALDRHDRAGARSLGGRACEAAAPQRETHRAAR